MKTLLRSSLSSLLYHGQKWFGNSVRKVRILTYHRVNDRESNYITVPVDAFQKQMEYLIAEGYQTISLAEFLNGTYGPKNAVVTFDDGYLDNFENAFPIMKRLGLKGTIFCIGNKINTPDFLGAAHIQEMKRFGFSFGSHTMTHPHLIHSPREQKWQEISGSKKFLENALQIPVDYFCYPYGEYDQESADLVLQAGYLGACTNDPGSSELLTEPCLLKRTEIARADTLFDFEKKLVGAFDLLHQGLHWARGKP